MRIFLSILTVLFLFSKAASVFAVTVAISNVPDTISDQPFNINISITGASTATNYLRVDYFQPGTTNYFGYTFNGTGWYNGSEFTQYLPIPVTSSVYTGSIQTKIDTNSTKFKGNGLYNLRIRRYTQSGKYIANESNVVTLNVNINSISSPTPTTPSTPAPTPVVTPTPTPKPLSSFTISNVPLQINFDQSFNVSVNLILPNNTNPVYYLAGAFKKSDGTRYFGLTKKDSNWIKYGDDTLAQYKITTDNTGSWTGVLEVKPDTSDSDYKGSGDYLFKVGRYTSSSSSPVWSNEIALKINDADTPSNASTAQPISINNSEASPLPTKLLSPRSKPTQLKSFYQIASVAAATISAQSATSPSQVNIKNTVSINPLILAGSILIFAGVSLIGYIYIRKNAKIHI